MQQDPAKAQLSRAATLLSAGKARDAEPILRKILKKNPGNVTALRLLAIVCAQTMNRAESLKLIEKAKKIAPGDPLVWIDATRLCKGEGRFDDAVSYARKAYKISPKHKETFALLAHAHVWSGQYQEAHDMLKEDAANGKLNRGTMLPWIDANFQLGNLEETVRSARVLCKVPAGEIPAGTRREILSTLGRALEKLGRFQEATEVFTELNTALPVSFDPKHATELNDRIMASYTEARFADSTKSKLGVSEVPVFVLGLPRSGTTLFERIIAAHPQAHAAGECEFLSDAINAQLPQDVPSSEGPVFVADAEEATCEKIRSAYMRDLTALTGRHDRIVNKNLRLPRLGGVIARCFPNARIIIPRRNPADVAISIWTHPFKTDFVPWATRLDWIAQMIREHERMIDYWKSVLPNPMLEIEYEALASDPEPHVRRIIDFLGLEWDDACLSHHIKSGAKKKARFMPTFSEHQVRRAINTGSVGRANRFGEVMNLFHEAYARP